MCTWSMIGRHTACAHTASAVLHRDKRASLEMARVVVHGCLWSCMCAIQIAISQKHGRGSESVVCSGSVHTDRQYVIEGAVYITTESSCNIVQVCIRCIAHLKIILTSPFACRDRSDLTAPIYTTCRWDRTAGLSCCSLRVMQVDKLVHLRKSCVKAVISVARS